MKNLVKKLHKVIKFWNLICAVLELVLAVLVTIAIVGSIISLIPGLGEMLSSGHAIDGFSKYLEEIFLCVIGIEFLQMLCQPTSDNVLETLIFLVARHMIINETTPVEDLISVCTIVLLVVVKRLLETDKKHSSVKECAESLIRKKEQAGSPSKAKACPSEKQDAAAESLHS